MMNGGRLVFTNLKNRAAFPSIEAPIPNTRLPYWLVDDLDVPLARAAALNANFPPIFPNARARSGWPRRRPCPTLVFRNRRRRAGEQGLISGAVRGSMRAMDLSEERG